MVLCHPLKRLDQLVSTLVRIIVAKKHGDKTYNSTLKFTSFGRHPPQWSPLLQVRLHSPVRFHSTSILVVAKLTYYLDCFSFNLIDALRFYFSGINFYTVVSSNFACTRTQITYLNIAPKFEIQNAEKPKNRIVSFLL